MARERRTLCRDGISGESEAEPRSHAIRAVDALAEGRSSCRAVGKSPAIPCREEQKDVSVPRPTVKRRMSEIPDEGDAILSISPEGLGESVAVTLRLAAPTEEYPDGRRVKLHLLSEQYADLSLRVGSITPEQADEIIEAGKLCGAIRRGLSILQYGDQSARKLAFKLTAKGIDRAVAEEAAAYLSHKGYIHEDDTARLRAEQNLRKLWGPSRIAEDLRAQGFSSDTVSAVLDELSCVDFVANCTTAIRKKYRTVPSDRAGREKLIAALMRLGYDVGTVREAMRLFSVE